MPKTRTRKKKPTGSSQPLIDLLDQGWKFEIMPIADNLYRVIGRFGWDGGRTARREEFDGDDPYVCVAALVKELQRDHT